MDFNFKNNTVTTTIEHGDTWNYPLVNENGSVNQTKIIAMKARNKKKRCSNCILKISGQCVNNDSYTICRDTFFIRYDELLFLDNV